MSQETPKIRLIVGLGNPGAKYENTRHNAGAWFVQHIAAQQNIALRYEPKYQGSHATITVNGQECHLLIPATFMNLSGQSVQAIANYYKIAANAMLIAHDEIDLPVDDIRIKFDGGHGGHNGLRDIMTHLNTKQFYRLRIGVGRPNHNADVVDYVLSHPSKAERKQLDTAIDSAIQVLPSILNGQFQQAMQLLHTKK